MRLKVKTVAFEGMRDALNFQKRVLAITCGFTGLPRRVDGRIVVDAFYDGPEHIAKPLIERIRNA